jgi:hypothetical protein
MGLQKNNFLVHRNWNKFFSLPAANCRDNELGISDSPAAKRTKNKSKKIISSKRI